MAADLDWIGQVGDRIGDLAQQASGGRRKLRAAGGEQRTVLQVDDLDAEPFVGHLDDNLLGQVLHLGR